MTDANKITQRIEQILRKEEQAEEELKFTKELFYMLECMNKTKLEKEKTISEIKVEFQSLEKENDKRQCDLELLKIELESWEKPLKDAHEVQKEILKQMDKLQQKKWSNQKRFCHLVGEFIDSHGTRAMMNRNFNEHIRGQMAAALSGTDAENIYQDNKKTLRREAKFQELQSDISKNETLIEELKTTLFNVQTLNGSLQKEYESGAEYKRLRNALKFSRGECSKYYAEMNCEMDINTIDATPKAKSQNVTKQTMMTDFIKPSGSHDFNNINIHGAEYSENELNSIYSEENQYNNIGTSNNSNPYEIVELLTPVKYDKQFKRDLHMRENNDGGSAKITKTEDMENIRNKISPRKDVYKEINLIKEKAKASGKWQIKKFNQKAPRK